MFQRDDMGNIMKQMALDISLMNQFNLMDYSFLLCVEYHPDYFEDNKENFREDPIYKNWVEKEKISKR